MHIELIADCSRCVGLCCVGPAFAASSDFAITKPAGQPCPHLGADHRCGIHDQLRERGFRGCVVFDCFGAGQRITQETYAGRPHWRAEPRMLDLLPVMRQLHELMWLLSQAAALPEARSLAEPLAAALTDIDTLAGGRPTELLALDVVACRERVNPLLQRASELARAGATHGPDHRGANLIGRRLRGADLRGGNLRGALLIGADLRDADLRRADFTGADLRGADLRGANLTGALFLTRSQLAAAITGPDADRP